MTGFIFPVGGDAVTGHSLHFDGANLHFDNHAVHAYQYGVQGLVAVGFGDGDIVFEFTGHRLEKIVHHAQGSVAVVNAVDDQAKGKYIHNVAKGAFLFAHFAVDAPEMLFATFDGGVYGFFSRRISIA